MRDGEIGENNPQMSDRRKKMIFEYQGRGRKKEKEREGKKNHFTMFDYTEKKIID